MGHLEDYMDLSDDDVAPRSPSSSLSTFAEYDDAIKPYREQAERQRPTRLRRSQSDSYIEAEGNSRNHHLLSENNRSKSAQHNESYETKVDNQLELGQNSDIENDIESAACSDEIDVKVSSYTEICSKQLPSYKWPTLIPTAFHYHPVHSTLYKEMALNPFLNFPLTALSGLHKECCALQKSKGHRVKTKQSGMHDEAGWDAGETITRAELLSVKIYTDCDAAQKQLKQCYRPPRRDNSADFQYFQQRLCHFRHWRQTLDLTILKFGEPLSRRVFYHGVDRLMKLEIHPTHLYFGPFSVSVDKDVARSFTGSKGFVMTICSRYPRLNSDYGLEVASIISGYPEEKEYVIRSLYTRILHIELGFIVPVQQLVNNTNGALHKLLCFVMSSMMANNIYSFDVHLERVFKALLIRTDDYRLEQDQQLLFEADDAKEMCVVQDIAAVIPDVFVQEFNARRCNQSCLKLDAISPKMRSLFFKNGQISLERILKFMPNLKELQLHENYKITDAFVAESTLFLRRAASIYTNFKCAKFMFYSFSGSPEQFQVKQSVSKSSIYALRSIGWDVTERHHSLSYKCIISRTTS